MRDDEDADELAATGQILVVAYLTEAAIPLRPQAIEQTVQGERPTPVVLAKAYYADIKRLWGASKCVRESNERYYLGPQTSIINSKFDICRNQEITIGVELCSDSNRVEICRRLV